MPAWVIAILTGVGKLVGVAADWWTKKQEQQHDDAVRSQQQTADALKGDADALSQVDRVNSSLDRPDDGVRNDTFNRNK
jgi:hypothetical protein